MIEGSHGSGFQSFMSSINIRANFSHVYLVDREGTSHSLMGDEGMTSETPICRMIAAVSPFEPDTKLWSPSASEPRMWNAPTLMAWGLYLIAYVQELDSRNEEYN